MVLSATERQILDKCLTESIPGVVSGIKSPEEYVAINTITTRILRRGWKVTLKNKHPEVSPDAVFKEFTDLVVILLIRVVDENRLKFKGAHANFSDEPVKKREHQYSIRGVVTVPEGEYKGEHQFRGIVFIKGNQCLIQSIRITLDLLVVKTDLLTLKGFLEEYQEISDLLEKYNLN